MRIRRVRTPEGARFFGLPIGSIITADALAQATKKHGRALTSTRLEAERNHIPDLPPKPYVPSPNSMDSMSADLIHDWGNLVAFARFNGVDVSKAHSGPIDGDGDGWVLDGTPQKRPATPEEMAAGARWRASRGQGSPVRSGGLRGKVQGAVRGAKDSFATNRAKATGNAPVMARTYEDHKFNLFHKAIDEAVHSQNPAMIDRVKKLIDSPLITNEADRKDLHAVLNARRDGLPDPAPQPGSNRAARTGIRGLARSIKGPSGKERTVDVAIHRQVQSERKILAQEKAKRARELQRRAARKAVLAEEKAGKPPKAPKTPKARPDGKKDTGLELATRAVEQNKPQAVNAPETPAAPKSPNVTTGKEALALLHSSPKRGETDPFQGFEGHSEDSPAGKALESGQDIEQIKDTTGLLGYIAENPDQFDLSIPRVPGGTAETMIVKDKENGRLYFFKMAENNDQTHMFGDGVNEVLSPQIANAAVPGLLPGADFVGAPSDKSNVIIRADHVTQFAKDQGIDVKSTAMTMNGFKVDKAAPGEDKKMLALHIFDYLSNQSDRHDAGVAVVTDKSGQQHYIGFDQGAAFSAHDSFLVGDLGFPPEFASSPESIDYAKWLSVMTDPSKGNKGGIAHGMAQRLYKGNEDQMRKDAEEILKQMKAVPLDKILSDLHKRFPDLPAYESAHLEAAARIWQGRLGRITADDIVKGMTGK